MEKKIYLLIVCILFCNARLFSQDNIKQNVDSAYVESFDLPQSVIDQYKNRKNNEELNSTKVIQKAISTSYAVGATQGSAEVTLSGAASYSVPIEVPKGVADLEPNVSINYNSQSGNGLLGYGWNVAAYSIISRTGKNQYFDGTTSDVKLTNADNLMLDGQRLMLIEGTSITSGSKYRLEFDPFTEVTFSSNGIDVTSADGIKKEYGKTTDSNIKSGTNTIFWLLNKTTDINGNTMQYTYTTGTDGFYLSKILYATNRTVEFAYADRNDKQNIYFCGAEVKVAKVLKTITTKISSTIVKRYDFNYDQTALYSKLTEIIENGQNARYNATTINYGSTGIQQDEYVASLTEDREGNRPLFADFNGDGIMDFLSYPDLTQDKTSYNANDVATVFIGQKNYGGTISYVKKGTIQIQFTGSVFQQFFLADLDGDGKMDLVNLSKASNGSYRYNFYMWDGTNLKYDYKGFNTDGVDPLVGDFNGDGKSEILVMDNQKVFDLNGNVIATGGITEKGTNYTEYFPNSRYLTDFNGNGKTDILMMNGSRGWVYELSGNSFVKLNEFNTTDIRTGHFVYFGDFNGDGYTDVLLQQNASSWIFDDVAILFSTGKGFVKKAIPSPDIITRVFIADFNRDGKSDIFHMQRTANGVRLKVGIFNGNDFTTTNYSTLVPYDKFVGIEDYEPFMHNVADFDGDGRPDFGNARYQNAVVIHTFNDTENKMVTNITDGLGAQTTFSYAPITNGSICTVSGNNPSFPVAGSLYPLYVVSQMQQYASGYSNTSNYKYKNPNMHLQGKGFLCFGEIEVTSPNKNKKVVTKYGINSTYYYPYATEQKVTTASGANISLTTYENAAYYQGNKRATPYVRKKTDTDYLTGVVKTTEITSTNTYGSPLTVTTKYGNDVTETLTYTYNSSTGTNIWRNKLPLTVTNKTTRSVGTWTEKEVTTYDANFRVKTVTSYTNDGTKQVKYSSFTYDAFGNVTVSDEKLYSATQLLKTTYGYSSDGVFQTSKTDPMSLTVSSTYNAYGQVSTSTDHLNKRTSYYYEGMGRVNRVVNPDGTESNKSYSWGSTPTYAVYYITESMTGKPTQKTYYDAINRELRSSTTKFNNTELKIDKKYDGLGRLSLESLPFTGSTASYWKTYTYDDYDRITRLDFPHGKRDSYSYSGTTISVTSKGMLAKKTYNGKGELTNVSDPAGSIAYTLRADGQVSKTTAPGNVVTSINYDEFGRKNEVTDPSAGKKTYKYDAAGNINEEIDADNRKKTMTYDKHGRMLTMVLPEFTTTYSYNAQGFLTSVSSTNGTSTTYGYDTYGRLLTEKDIATDGKYLEKGYTYTSGNVSAVQFTSQSGSIGTETYTYAYGNLSEIKFGSVSVWKINSENTFGLPTSVSTGPVTRSYTYNSYGIPTGRSASSSNSGTFQNYTYNIDANNNTSFRKDAKRNIQESFTYDGLNRLSTFSGHTMTYDVKGNILKKPDVSTSMAYSLANKPYAISEVDAGTNNSIAARNQTITYTSFERPLKIVENNYEASFIYDVHGGRKKMHLKKNNANELQRYYMGDRYEFDTKSSGTKQKLYIGGNAYNAIAAYVNEGSSWQLYYITRDHLGSITQLTNSSGSLYQEYSYDAWGRLRNPVNQSVYLPDNAPAMLLDRGYTGHEHLQMFGLVNMNARLYDPAIGRFLSPDPYVQLPDFTQNFNRYAYAMNNPMLYIDQDGEFAWIPFAIVFGVGFTAGYVSHGIINHNWGWNAVYSGLLGGAMAVGGFYAATGTVTVGSALKFAGNMLINQGLGYIIPPVDLFSIGDFSLSFSPFAMFTGFSTSSPLKGFSAGGGLNASYKLGDWTISAGYAKGQGVNTGYGGFSYNDGKKGFSYYHNYYGNKGSQRTGTLGVQLGKFSLRWENDAFARTGDKYRSNAIELGIGDYVLGTNVYTTNHFDENPKHNLNGSAIFTDAKYGTYNDGFVQSSPLYLGKKSKYGMTRIGINDPLVGDFVQNGFHRYVVPTAFFMHDTYNRSSPYISTGRYLQNSLY